MKAVPEEILAVNCRIRSKNVGGSGTVIYSKENEDGNYSTYVLTNHHVVDNSIKLVENWSPILKRNKKEDMKSMVEVHLFKWQYGSRAIGSILIDADIMTYDKNEDLALLKLRDPGEVPCVATFYPKEQEKDLKLGMPVLAIGAGLGEPPIITGGRLSRFAMEIDNREFWLQTGATIFGNSGGAVFLEETGEFIGVPARIAVTMAGFSVSPITHMSYMIPITRVYKFLDDQLFRFIYDPEYTEEGEAEERERRRKNDERHFATTGDNPEDTQGAKTTACEMDENGDLKV